MRNLQRFVKSKRVSNIPLSARKRMNLIPCKSFQRGNPIDGYDFDCEYEPPNGYPVDCSNCVCTGGHDDPRTGKRFYQKHKEEPDGTD